MGRRSLFYRGWKNSSSVLQLSYSRNSNLLGTTNRAPARGRSQELSSVNCPFFITLSVFQNNAASFFANFSHPIAAYTCATRPPHLISKKTRSFSSSRKTHSFAKSVNVVPFERLLSLRSVIFSASKSGATTFVIETAMQGCALRRRRASKPCLGSGLRAQVAIGGFCYEIRTNIGRIFPRYT